MIHKKINKKMKFGKIGHCTMHVVVTHSLLTGIYLAVNRTNATSKNLTKKEIQTKNCTLHLPHGCQNLSTGIPLTANRADDGDYTTKNLTKKIGHCTLHWLPQFID